MESLRRFKRAIIVIFEGSSERTFGDGFLHGTLSGNLKIHVKSVHEKVRYRCKSCDYEATHPSHLNRHFKTIHEQIKYECVKCDYKANQAVNLRRHVKNQHGKDQL